MATCENCGYEGEKKNHKLRNGFTKIKCPKCEFVYFRVVIYG